jgi:hypothetical protein
VDPSSIVGDSLVWKDAQKNETNKISDTINRIIPHPRIPFFVATGFHCHN